MGLRIQVYVQAGARMQVTVQMPYILAGVQERDILTGVQLRDILAGVQLRDILAGLQVCVCVC